MSELLKKTNGNYPLNDSTIDEISATVQSLLTTLKYDKKNLTRIRLLIEDAMLIWREKFGETSCAFTVGKRFNKAYMSLEIKGDRLNPFEKENEMFGEWGQNLIDGLGFYPTFTYSSGVNKIKFDLKMPKMSSIAKILIAVVSSVILGLLGNFIPDNVLEILNTQVLTRLSDVFFGLIGAVAGPLVFLSVLTGICSIGDTATLGSMGKTAVKGFVGITFLTSVISGVLLPFVFGTNFGEAQGSSAITKIIDMIFGMIPHNLFSPFIEGNCLQIIVIAVAFGVALLMIGKKTSGLVNIVEQLYCVIRLFMSWVGGAIPVFIFVILLQNMWSGSFNTLLQAWKPFVVTIISSSILLVVVLAFSSVRNHISISKLFRAVLPAALIALTTASSMAALSEAVFCCETRFRVKKKYINFSLPIGAMLCKPCETISFTAFIIYSMKTYDIDLSVSSVILLILSVALVIIAAPPVPGGFISCYAVLFAQFAIPTEALAVVITLDVFTDFFDTAINTAVRQLAVFNQAKKLDAVENTSL